MIPPTVVMDILLDELFTNTSRVRRINAMLLHFRVHKIEAGN